MQLSAWLNACGLSPVELAARLGLSRQTVYGWLNGDYGPSRKHLLQIVQITKGKVGLADFAVNLAAPVDRQEGLDNAQAAE